MLVCDYIVESIDGDYAHLRRTDLPEEELKLVARALLPFDITEGCRLHYEMMQYSIMITGANGLLVTTRRKTRKPVVVGQQARRQIRLLKI